MACDVRSLFMLALICSILLSSLPAPSLSLRLPGVPSVEHPIDNVDLGRRDDVPFSGQSTERMVSIVLDIDDTKHMGNSAETHTYLQFAGTKTDGPLRVELVMQKAETGGYVGVIRALDDTVEASSHGIPLVGGSDRRRLVFKYHPTLLTNTELLDPANGRGALWVSWMKDPYVRSGPGHVAPSGAQGGTLKTGQTFVTDVLDTIFRTPHSAPPALDPQLIKLMRLGDKYRKFADAQSTREFTRFLHETQLYQGGRPAGQWRTTFETNVLGQPYRTGWPGEVSGRDLFAIEVQSPRMPELPIAPNSQGLLNLGRPSGSANSPGRANLGEDTPSLGGSASDRGTAGTSASGHGSPGSRGSGSGSGDSLSIGPGSGRPDSLGSVPGDPNSGHSESIHSGPTPGDRGTASFRELELAVTQGYLPADGKLDTQDLEQIAREPAAAHRGAAPQRGAGGRVPGQVPAPRGLATLRNDAVLAKIWLTTFKVLEGVGIIATVAAVAFIIVDLVKGEYVSAAIGVVGLALGGAAFFAINAGIEAGLIASGPVGWIIGGIVALALAIIPFFIPIHHKKPKPERQSVQQILQWVMFGDRDKTGNENCRKAGQPDCQALYGPGIVSHAFGWDNFDGFVYLIQFNQGYAMSIPDMAKTFHVLDPKVAYDGANATALIDCQGDKSTCEFPKFLLRRANIVIPVINDTADHIVTRIIPSPGGDCKLVADPVNGQHYPDYGITITGQPAAIACGIVESEDVAGVVISMGPSTGPLLNLNQTALTFNLPGNDSTGNGGDAYVAAPSIHPFRQLSPADGLVCLGSATDSHDLCLSNGSYTLKSGDWRVNITEATTLTMPAGAAIRWGRHKDVTANVSLVDQWFHNDIQHFNGRKGDKVWVTVRDQVPNVVCLYAEELYEGNCACFGEGGDMLPQAIRKQAKSIAVHGDAVAWIYADHYGDTGGTRISTNIPDLASIAYGIDRNFSQDVVAMWVSVGSESIASAKAKRFESSRLPAKDIREGLDLS